jgi:peptidoglycan/xylan/chitin deacetylase (PgdA/CDA1 family)
MKQTALKLMRASGAFDLLRLMHRRRALILTYHRFSWQPDAMKTSAAALAEQLAYLTTHYQVVPVSRLAELLAVKGRLPAGLAAITIDDGYCDAYDIALPLLRRFKAPATFYLVTEFIDRVSWVWTDIPRFLTTQTTARQLTTQLGDRQIQVELTTEGARIRASEKINAVLKTLPDETREAELQRLASELGVTVPASPPGEFGPVSWNQAREMEARGVELGSHTVRHPILTNTGDAQLRRELSDSRSRLEEVLKHPVEHFCYPNGNYDARVRNAAAQAGYLSAVTCDGGLNQLGDDPLALRRLPTEEDFVHFVQSASGFETLKTNIRMMGRRPALTPPSPLAN